MPENLLVALLALAVVVVAMLAETAVSWRHTQRLRARGAIEPPGDVWPWLEVTYPSAFVAMALEGAIAGVAGPGGRLLGALLFVAAKALKYWAIVALGERWSFRVLVLPGVPLVTRGPYRWLRHPNYVAVGGELLGMALLLRARVSGPVALIGFAILLWRRIRIEERALGLRS
jgi:methyltransferase